MIKCTFHLNGGQLSTLNCPGIGFFPAYSGNQGINRNNPDSVTLLKKGPLPPGQYYIVSRQRGGLRTRVNDFWKSMESESDRNLWFALYRVDDRIDDLTFIDNVNRGSFRLHPAGRNGNSDGCITLVSLSHYMILWRALITSPKLLVSAELEAFGTIQVY
ncbi:DUF2778 domain-containing protein [Atlantibacter sp.]|uniref:DUF2778 domain-containing protein n=1 Tax=Atlantibacter sp. TaxID=1903473 RepID=UPI0028A71D8D|nr:DUF2778 domain-containing protein [Atlantibacter sp.]